VSNGILAAIRSVVELQRCETKTSEPGVNSEIEHEVRFELERIEALGMAGLE
jgi:hypothetical protein